MFAMKKLEKMEEVKKPASAPEKPKKREVPVPLFLLLSHIGCMALFLLCMGADWLLGDIHSQTITSTAVFVLPVMLAAVLLLWERKLPDNTSLGSPAFIVACFFVIGVIWIMFYLRFTDMHEMVAISPDAAEEITKKEFQNEVKLSVFIFGIIYTVTDTLLMIVYFLIRRIVSMIREAGRKKS